MYIATPTKGRVELVLKCAQAGKHMIAEKPLAETAKEVETMINACRWVVTLGDIIFLG